MIKKIITLGFVLTGLSAKPINPSTDSLKSMLNQIQSQRLADIEATEIKDRATAKVTKIVKTAKKDLGKRYVYGANSKRAVDCSSFVQQVYKKHKTLPRTSRQQAKVGKRIKKKDLAVGDLVFFSSKKTRQVAHVGIYIGRGNFIHASSAKKKVVITKLNKAYYKRHYKGARRVI